MESNGFLVVKGSEGLGNRILGALTGLLYARVTGRRLVIDWRDETYSDDGANVFGRLFDCEANRGVEEVPSTASVAPKLWRGQLAMSVPELRAATPDMSKVEFARRSSIDLTRSDYAEDVLVMWANTEKIEWLRPHFRGPFALYATQSTPAIMQRLLGTELTLRPEIRDRAELFRQERFRDRTVGVHVRYTDKSVRLGDLLDQVASLLRSEPGLQIFLATDNLEIRRMFEGYPDVVWAGHWLPATPASLHKHPDRPNRLESAIEALVDMHLLARCDYLVVDTVSSFAQVATLLSRAPERNIVDLSRPTVRRRLKELGWRRLAQGRLVAAGLGFAHLLSWEGPR